MKISLISTLVFLAAVASGDAEETSKVNSKVVLDTSKGQIVLELFADKAPVTVSNFLDYVDAKFYDGTIFHRVIPDFMIQGGGFTPAMKQKPTKDPIKNEADNGLENQRGTIAMARTGDPHSATGQFFINSVNNDFLNFKSKTPQGWGYAVFGKVVAGIEVVDAISAVKTKTQGMYQDVPAEPVVINSARRLE